MPDITMCTNSSCQVKEACYRWIAIPNSHWQSYASFDGPNEDAACRDFVECTERELEVFKQCNTTRGQQDEN